MNNDITQIESTKDNSITAQIKSIKEILDIVNLEIPFYQRPYRWEKKNVKALLDDIFSSWKKGKKSYRIGSLIIHKEKNNESAQDFRLNIVDGQQRVTTILLLIKVLGKNKIGENLLNKLEYAHSISHINICKNDLFIKSWIKEISKNDKEDFEKYLLNKCEFVKIIVNDISEAFQMFDSQNSRGKELEAYNLLKAYHMRAMETESEKNKIDADRNWENATMHKIVVDDQKEKPKDILKQIFNEQVYRTRKWCRKENAFHFNKQKIDEFKGLTIDETNTIEYPFQNLLLLQHIANNYLNTTGVQIKGLKKRFNNPIANEINQFVLINQNIINGKYFFEYIETYVEIYKQLFLENSGIFSDFYTFFENNCSAYKGHSRSGDGYLKEVYKSVIFLLFDKFGEVEVEKYYVILYILIYKYRLEKLQVKYNFISKDKDIQKIFTCIEYSTNPSDLQTLMIMVNKEIDVKFNVKEIIDVCKKEDIKLKMNIRKN